MKTEVSLYEKYSPKYKRMLIALYRRRFQSMILLNQITPSHRTQNHLSSTTNNDGPNLGSELKYLAHYTAHLLISGSNKYLLECNVIESSE